MHTPYHEGSGGGVDVFQVLVHLLGDWLLQCIQQCPQILRSDETTHWGPLKGGGGGKQKINSVHVRTFIYDYETTLTHRDLWKRDRRKLICMYNPTA